MADTTDLHRCIQAVRESCRRVEAMASMNSLSLIHGFALGGALARGEGGGVGVSDVLNSMKQVASSSHTQQCMHPLPLPHTSPPLLDANVNLLAPPHHATATATTPEQQHVPGSGSEHQQLCAGASGSGTCGGISTAVQHTQKAPGSESDQQVNFCAFCGKSEHQPQARFCSNCGKKLAV